MKSKRKIEKLFPFKGFTYLIFIPLAIIKRTHILKQCIPILPFKSLEIFLIKIKLYWKL